MIPLETVAELIAVPLVLALAYAILEFLRSLCSGIGGIVVDLARLRVGLPIEPGIVLAKLGSSDEVAHVAKYRATDDNQEEATGEIA